MAVPEFVLNRNLGVGSSRSPTAFDVPWVHAVIASNKAFIRTSGASMRRIDKLTVPNSKSPTWIVFIIELPMIFNLGILLVQFIRSSFCVALGETIGRESSRSPEMSFRRINVPQRASWLGGFPSREQHSFVPGSPHACATIAPDHVSGLCRRPAPSSWRSTPECESPSDPCCRLPFICFTFSQESLSTIDAVIEPFFH